MSPDEAPPHPGSSRGARRGRPPSVDRAAAVEASIKLLREHGPVGVTARGLADALGVSRQVLYTLFGSHAGLVDALYRTGFERLRAAAPEWDDAVVGVSRVTAHALAYREFALANPELYTVMFEHPFRSYAPTRGSRQVALAALEPLVDVITATGRSYEQARDVSFTLWASLHGLVHLELQGYLAFETTTEARLVTVVHTLLTG